MQFFGYWVFGVGEKVWVTPYMFDETELSDTSDYTAAWSNGEVSEDGFVEHVPNPLIKNICNRILGREERFIEQEPHKEYKGEVIWINSPAAFAEFILSLDLKDPVKRNNPPPVRAENVAPG